MVTAVHILFNMNDAVVLGDLARGLSGQTFKIASRNLERIRQNVIDLRQLNGSLEQHFGHSLLVAVLDLLHRIGDDRREIVGGLLREDITDIKLDRVSDEFALGTRVGKLHRSGHFLT